MVIKILGNLYVIVNNINGKLYVGKTYLSIEKRFSQHIYDSKKQRYKNKPLYKAMNKYGVENFSIQHLGSYEEDVLEEKEIEFIEKYNSYIKCNGYNATLGGDGKKHIKLKDEDVIEKYFELKNITRVAKFYQCDSAIIKRILKLNNIEIFDAKYVNKHKQVRKIKQLDLNGNIINVFESVINACEWIILNCEITTRADSICNNINRCANQNRNTAYGYVWEFII